MKYAIDWSKFNWQHYILVVASAVAGVAAALPTKAAQICAAAHDVAACSNSLVGWCTTIGPIAVAITLVFGGSSQSLLKKKEEPAAPATP